MGMYWLDRPTFPPPRRRRGKEKTWEFAFEIFFYGPDSEAPDRGGFLPGGGWFEGGSQVGFSVTPCHYHWAVGISLRFS